MVAKKLKALIVGGEDRNIPDEAREVLDFKHIEQSAKSLNEQSCPEAACVILITKFSREPMAVAAKKVARKRGIPFVPVKTGNYIIHELVHHKLIAKPEPAEKDNGSIVDGGGRTEIGPMDAVGEGAVASSPSTLATPDTVGLSPEQLWDRYGQKAIETLKSTLKPGEKVTEDDLLAIFSIDGGVGLPRQDALELLPELSIRGVIAVCKGGWRLVDHNTMVDGVEQEGQEDDHVEVKSVLAVEPPKIKDVKPPSIWEGKGGNRCLKKRSREETCKFFGGLPDRLYETQADLWREALKYKEFSFTDGTPYAFTYYWSIVPHGIKYGNVKEVDPDKVGGGFRIVPNPDVKLTLRDDLPAEEPKQGNRRRKKEEKPKSDPEPAPVQKPLPKRDVRPETTKDIVAAVQESFEGGQIPTIDHCTMATRFLKKLMPERYWDSLACQYIARVVNIGRHDNAMALKAEFSKMEWDRLAYGVLAELPVKILVPFMKDEPKDEELTCVECMAKFIFTVQEWKFYQDRFGDEATFPKRCPKCRKLKG